MIKRNLLVMGLAVLLSACGFQLRGTGTNELAIKELDLSARNAYGEVVTQPVSYTHLTLPTKA